MKFDFGSLEKDIEADWPVRVQVPQDDGKVLEQTLSLRFRLHGDAELVSLGMGLEAVKAALRKCVVGFGRSEEQAFTPELFDQMMNRAYVRTAIVQAYGEFALGIPAKN